MSSKRKMGARRETSGSKKTTGAARKSVNYDLHNHVVPPSVIDAIIRDPEGFGTRVEEKNGKRYFDSHGRMTELLPEFCDVEAKIAWMDRGRLLLRPFLGARPRHLFT